MISQYLFYILGGYYILAGLLGMGMYFIWITLRLRIKIYDFEELYGVRGARIISIIFGFLFLLLGYLSDLFL